jgi:hypothetical protein
MILKDLPIIEVTWVDSFGCGDWHDTDETMRFVPAECRTVGWLMKDAPDYWLIAMTVSLTQTYGSMCIPKRSMVSVKIIYDPASDHDAKETT